MTIDTYIFLPAEQQWREVSGLQFGALELSKRIHPFISA
jgi:hypothetical protein